MDDLITHSLVYLILLFVLWTSGKFFLFFTDTNSYLRGFELLIGFSILTFYISFIFIFNINIRYLLYSYLLAFICFTFFLKKENFLQIFRSQNLIMLLIGLLPFLFFIFIHYIYGANFTLFRGNIWDWFNYNTMAVAYSKYTIFELLTFLL